MLVQMISNVWMMKLVLVIILLLQLAGGQSSALNDKLVAEFSKMTGFNVLDQKYREVKSNKTSPHTKGQNLSEIFIKRLQILQKTVEKVESRLKTYIPPEQDEDSIMWAGNLSESLCDLLERGPYKQPICLKNSSVHIPIDIFKGNKNMLKNVFWSSLFDEVWVQNMATHPDLLWQYFGSTSGLLRFYPGTSWPLRYKDKEGEDIDLYDVRRRSWFVQGMSLPKDMLILIDSSGSSQGQALALMKHITRSLLETLNENDQINILTFPQETNEMNRPPCFSSFVKATFRNKQVALDYTKKIISTGIANFSKALEASFAFFENITSNVSEGFSGSHCNQMIMLLTDGGNEKPREVLRKYNSLQKIRIFTYLIGPISTDAPAIKWIAEKSRGEFYQIPSIVAIRSKTQDYIRFLSESKANLTNALTWTSASLDYLNDELVVSVTAPLFNKSSEDLESNKTILGVLGIDLPVRQFINSLPYELGEYGYFFIINSQGYVLYHPRLLDMREEFLNVDILDLEADVNMEEVRRKMIDGEKGELSVDDYDDLLDEHHVNIKRRTYRYEPIQGTEFSLCVVLYDEVKDGFKEMKITGSVDSEIFFTIHDTDVILDDSKYCSDEEEEEEGNTTEIERFSERITKFKCDVDKLKGLIFDILQTNSTGDLWTREEEEEPGIVVKFIETPNMFRLYPQNSSEYLLPKYLNFKERVSKSRQWFVTVYDKETMVDNETAVILLVEHRITNGNLTLAVIGGLVLEQWLQNIVFEDLVEPDNETDTISYLLDDGGIIVSTNLYPVHSTHYVGLFFGQDFIEGEVMKDMINNSIYKMHRSTGYLANCRDLELVGFSPRLGSFVPFMELLSPKWWLSVFVAQLTWVTSIFQVLMSSLESLASGEVFFDKFEIPKEKEYCAKEFFKYSFADKSQEKHSRSFDCGNCTKSYTTEMLKDLNVLLVKVTSEDSCRCPESYDPLKFKPQPNLNETHLRSSFYRKYVPCRPYFSEKEESYSSSVRRLPSRELLSALLMLTYYLFDRVVLV